MHFWGIEIVTACLQADGLGENTGKLMLNSIEVLHNP